MPLCDIRRHSSLRPVVVITTQRKKKKKKKKRKKKDGHLSVPHTYDEVPFSPPPSTLECREEEEEKQTLVLL
ncbi:Uncharacterized protein APZ42_027508 [Daphnia magna]|uniref:Uncharacterized protein n=1 Tax=Daphnia magna TaxID=35525 RepID=A0A164RMI0_9CRUS|nr:Uncharacterized protein APZ42_027508 [Daphnia magna]